MDLEELLLLGLAAVELARAGFVNNNYFCKLMLSVCTFGFEIVLLSIRVAILPQNTAYII